MSLLDLLGPNHSAQTTLPEPLCPQRRMVCFSKSASKKRNDPPPQPIRPPSKATLHCMLVSTLLVRGRALRRLVEVPHLSIGPVGVEFGASRSGRQEWRVVYTSSAWCIQGHVLTCLNKVYGAWCILQLESGLTSSCLGGSAI